MSRDRKIFESENVTKLIMKFALPIMLSMLVAELYAMVDTIFVGKYVSDKAIASLLIVFPLSRIFFALGALIAIGTATGISRNSGGNNIENMKKYIGMGWMLNLIIMPVIILFVTLFPREILSVLGSKGVILDGGVEYLRIVAIGILFLNLTVFISHTMMSLGNNKLAVISNSIGAAVNIILDYIFVVKFDLGIKGAALATITSQMLAFAYAFAVFYKLKKEHNIKIFILPSMKFIIPIVLVGLSAFVIESEDGFVIGILSNMLSEHGSEISLVVLGIATKIYLFLFIAMFALASAMQPIIAYNLGAKDYDQLYNTINKTRKISMIISIACWVIAMVFAPQLIKVFVNNPRVIKEGAKWFRIMISAYPFLSTYYLSIFYFQAVGKSRMSLFLSLFRQLIVLLPVALFCTKSLGLGEIGIWIAFPMADIISGGISVFLIKSEEESLKVQVKDQIKVYNCA